MLSAAAQQNDAVAMKLRTLMLVTLTANCGPYQPWAAGGHLDSYPDHGPGLPENENDIVIIHLRDRATGPVRRVAQLRRAQRMGPLERMAARLQPRRIGE